MDSNFIFIILTVILLPVSLIVVFKIMPRIFPILGVKYTIDKVKNCLHLKSNLFMLIAYVVYVCIILTTCDQDTSLSAIICYSLIAFRIIVKYSSKIPKLKWCKSLEDANAFKPPRTIVINLILEILSMIMLYEMIGMGKSMITYWSYSLTQNIHTDLFGVPYVKESIINFLRTAVILTFIEEMLDRAMELFGAEFIIEEAE